MAVIDTLQILVEADAKGIEQVLKKVLTQATGTVNAINKQEVDWTSIFTRSVSPAIIGAIASTFAFAISQSMQFQQAMNQTGTAAGQSALQIGQLSQGALDLSTQVPASAQDIATAMTQMGAIFNDVGDQQKVVEAMSQLAASGFGGLNDITKASIDIFKQWGVTTTDDAISVLHSLMHGAEAAKESIPALADQFSSVTPPLIIAGLGLKDFNKVLSTFSATVKNIGTEQAKAMFQSIAEGASDASSPVAIFGGGVEAIRRSLKDNGGLDTIKKLADVMSTKFGDNVGLIAKAFGFSAINTEAFILAGQKMPQLSSDAKNVASSTETIGEAYAKSGSALRELQLLWGEFKADMTNVGSLFLPLIGGFAKVTRSWLADAKAFFREYTNDWGDVISSFSNSNTAVDDVLNKSIASSINSRLASTGVGFSDSALARIDKTAEQSGLSSQLLHALNSGLGKGDNSYAQLNNTFHLTVPAGSSNLTAKMIATQLYNQFQGI